MSDMSDSNVLREPKQYRSPRHKLLKFFEKSRDRWKAKCLEAKATVRQVKNRATWLAQSRDAWKARSQAQATRIRDLERQVRDQQQTIQTLKKSPPPPPPQQLL